MPVQSQQLQVNYDYGLNEKKHIKYNLIAFIFILNITTYIYYSAMGV